MAVEYKLSGKVGLGEIVVPLIGLPACFALAFVYAYIDVYNPLVYFTAIAWIGYLVGIMFVIVIATRVSSCRNPPVAVLAGALVGLGALQATWGCFLHVLMERSDMMSPGLMALVLDPAMTLELAKELAEVGWFQIGSGTPTGAMLWALWSIEGAGIVLAGLYGGYMALHEEAYCEDCREWAVDIEYDRRLLMGDDPSVVESAASGDVDRLLELEEAEHGVGPHIRVNLKRCPSCMNVCTLDLDLITHETNDDGEVEESAEDMSPMFLLTPEQFTRFIDDQVASRLG